MEPAHLRQIRQEANEEENNDEEQMINEDKNTETKRLKLKMIFNEEELKRKAKKEIAFIRKKKAKKRTS